MPAVRPMRHARPRQQRIAVGRALEAVLCMGVIFTFAYFFVGYAQGSNDFIVRQVAIYGLSYLDEQTVLQQSGVSSDGNVFSVNESEIARRVEELPFVEHCEVRRVYPDTIALHIGGRVSAAVLHAGLHAYESDRSGVVLREYGPSDMPVDPFITEVSGTEFIAVGEHLSNPALHSALAVWDAFRVSSLYGRLTVSELVAVRSDDVRMYCDEVPYEIRWGRDDYGELARRLEAMWARFDGQLPCYEYVDLRFGEDVACK